jgi:hypothetical protein
MDKIVIQNENIFISCSCLVPKSTYTPGWTKEARLKQLMELTIESCRKVPDSINIISEASILDEPTKNIISEKSILMTWDNDDIIQNVTNDKQLGPLYLWEYCLKRLIFKRKSNIFFITGRYELTENFNLENFSPDFVFKSLPPDCVGMQMFKVSSDRLEDLLKIIEVAKPITGIGKLEIEKSMLIALQSLNIDFSDVQLLGCKGNVGMIPDYYQEH